MKPDIDAGSSQSVAPFAVFAATFAGADVYRQHAFRLAELGVEATDRDFKRRIEAVEGAEKIKVPPPPGPGRALPLERPVDAVQLREIFQRLGNDPEKRILEEFFWFWPQNPGEGRTDPALQALSQGNPAAAAEIWSTRAQHSETSIVAAHNLAVLTHFQAVEAEVEATTTSLQQRQTLCYNAFSGWKKIEQSEALWRRISARIAQINDPRLTGATATRLENWLPRGLLTINAQLAVRHLAAGRTEDANWQISLLKSGLYPHELVDDVLAQTAAPSRDEVRKYREVTASEASGRPEHCHILAKRLLEQTRAPLAVLDLFLGESDPTRKAARDDAAEQIAHLVIEYGNSTEDWAAVEPLLTSAVKLAATAPIRERHEKNLDKVRANAKETNRWRGTGYRDLPAACVAELDRAFGLAEAGKHSEAVAAVADVLAGALAPAVPETGRPVIGRTLACALWRKAGHELAAAGVAFNEVLPQIARLTHRARAGEFVKSRDGFFSTPCDVCGGSRGRQTFILRLPGGDAMLCAGCNSSLQSAQQRKERSLKATLAEALATMLLAAELNPSSPQIAETMRTVSTEAAKFRVGVPASTTPLRIELGIVPEPEMFAAALAWFSPQRVPARRWLQKKHPERHREFRQILRKRLTTLWSVAAAAAAMLIGWVAWTSRPATLALSVAGADRFELTVDGKTYPLTASSPLPTLAPGSRRIAVQAPGFRSAQRTVDVQPGGKVQWNVELAPTSGDIRPMLSVFKPADTSYDVGTLANRVGQKPTPVRLETAREQEIARDVTVLVDGAEVTVVNGAITGVKPGRHKVEARHPLCDPAEIAVEVKDRLPAQAAFTLVLKKATLTVVAAELADCLIVVDGSERNYHGERVTLDLQPERHHQISVTRRGYRKATLNFEAKAGGEEIWRPSLETLHGDLEPTATINGQPAPPGFAETLTWKIDSKEMPLVNGRIVKIPEGSIQVEVIHPDYDGPSGTLHIKDGETLKLDANLVPKAGLLRLKIAGPSNYTASIDSREHAASSSGYPLSPGVSHRIIVRAPGYLSAEKTVMLGPNENQVWDVQLQEIAKPKEGSPWQVPDLDLAMAWIAPGQFKMGSDTGGNRDERPVTTVRLTRGFWLGTTEVTQAQWKAVMGDNPSRFKGENRPVENISWNQAIQFCGKLTERERTAGRLPPDLAYTLPAEAQWEYACRAGTTGEFAGELAALAWFGGNSGGETHPVAQKRPNAWGLHDMHGNVAELCLDGYRAYSGGMATDPIGVPGSSSVARGGRWDDLAPACRSAVRKNPIAAARPLQGTGLGLRLALYAVPR